MPDWDPTKSLHCLAKAEWARSIARRTRLGREVAVKVLREGATTDKDRLDRFILEAGRCAQSPDSVTVHDIGTEGGSMVMGSSRAGR